jgi:hypothetical protein
MTSVRLATGPPGASGGGAAGAPGASEVGGGSTSAEPPPLLPPPQPASAAASVAVSANRRVHAAARCGAPVRSDALRRAGAWAAAWAAAAWGVKCSADIFFDDLR